MVCDTLLSDSAALAWPGRAAHASEGQRRGEEGKRTCGGVSERVSLCAPRYARQKVSAAHSEYPRALARCLCAVSRRERQARELSSSLLARQALAGRTGCLHGHGQLSRTRTGDCAPLPRRQTPPPPLPLLLRLPLPRPRQRECLRLPRDCAVRAWDCIADMGVARVGSSSASPSPAPQPSTSSTSSSPQSPAVAYTEWDPNSTDPTPVWEHHVPLKRTHGVHVGTLHLRSYTQSRDDLTFFTNFALRAARALELPTSGATYLPTRVWLRTVVRSPFAHKKSQQNFWRRTHKRAIKVYDGDERIVQAWFAYLAAQAMPGVGMKAQYWTYRPVGWGNKLVSETEMREYKLGRDAAQAKATAAQGAGTVKALADKLAQELQRDVERAEAEGQVDAAAPAKKVLEEVGGGEAGKAEWAEDGDKKA